MHRHVATKDSDEATANDANACGAIAGGASASVGAGAIAIADNAVASKLQVVTMID